MITSEPEAKESVVLVDNVGGDVMDEGRRANCHVLTALRAVSSAERSSSGASASGSEDEL